MPRDSAWFSFWDGEKTISLFDQDIYKEDWWVVCAVCECGAVCECDDCLVKLDACSLALARLGC